MTHARYERMPSAAMGRPVHLWSYGWWGEPVIALPTAAGMAHEWQHVGMVEALAPWIEGGRIKLYCPETNVSEAWTGEGDPGWRMARHHAYEAFVVHELVPRIRAECHTPGMPVAIAGASMGALYAANFALKHPETFTWALCMSGRYSAQRFFPGLDGLDRYYNDPLSYVPNLHGDALARIRRHTRLVLVVGRGPFENGCIGETVSMADALAERGVPHERDLWGHDVSHQWEWWRRQVLYHFGRRFA
ncbi:MAG: alpha/beta hydrolase-fold protein [Myxococcota bacterium]